MAFMDTLNSMAKSLTDATEEVVGTGKLTAKKVQETNLAEDELRKIGRVYYDRFIETGKADDFALEYLNNAKMHYEEAAKAQEEKEKMTIEGYARRNAPTEPTVGKYCTVCGTKCVMDAVVCSNCGHKF